MSRRLQNSVPTRIFQQYLWQGVYKILYRPGYSNTLYGKAFRNIYIWHDHPEDEGSMDLWNFGILPQYYAALQPGRPRLKYHRRESFKSRIRMQICVSDLI